MKSYQSQTSSKKEKMIEVDWNGKGWSDPKNNELECDREDLQHWI